MPLTLVLCAIPGLGPLAIYKTCAHLSSGTARWMVLAACSSLAESSTALSPMRKSCSRPWMLELLKREETPPAALAAAAAVLDAAAAAVLLRVPRSAVLAAGGDMCSRVCVCVRVCARG